MPSFDRNIDAAETAAHIVFWGALACRAGLILRGAADARERER
ncbi:hypothetical protein ACFY19_22770 [Streptosporangium saharense]